MSSPDDPFLAYALQHSSGEDEILNRLSRETHLSTVYPHMLSGPLQGRLLEMISHMMKPSRILEIGTFTGYSGICLARGLAEGGILHTIDINDETSLMAQKYFGAAGLSDRIVLHTGDAVDIVPALDEAFDLVFIDADKEQYLAYYHAVFTKLKIGGFILADNVLWGGKVLPGSKFRDKETGGILEFNIFVEADIRVEKLLIPLRDGLFMIRKLTG
jgi:caffeoyl-CoA O-methyltransferase